MSNVARVYSLHCVFARPVQGVAPALGTLIDVNLLHLDVGCVTQLKARHVEIEADHLSGHPVIEPEFQPNLAEGLAPLLSPSQLHIKGRHLSTVDFEGALTRPKLSPVWLSCRWTRHRLSLGPVGCSNHSSTEGSWSCHVHLNECRFKRQMFTLAIVIGIAIVVTAIFKMCPLVVFIVRSCSCDCTFVPFVSGAVPRCDSWKGVWH